MVLTTSATSGPAGSQLIGSRGSPSGVVTIGSGCSSGEGKPRTTTSSSSAMPTPLGGTTGTTGWNEPRATAVSRSLIRVSIEMSSPDSQRSSRVSSSDS